MQIDPQVIKSIAAIAHTQPHIPFSMVTIESDVSLDAQVERLVDLPYTFGSVCWAPLSPRRLLLVTYGLESLSQLTNFISDTFQGLCNKANTGFGIARYPLDALVFAVISRNQDSRTIVAFQHGGHR